MEEGGRWEADMGSYLRMDYHYLRLGFCIFEAIRLDMNQGLCYVNMESDIYWLRLR
jgi:hypothetical protein